MNTRRILAPALAVTLLAGAFSAWTVAVQDQSVDLPHDFAAGTPARASEVNANFQTVVSGLDAAKAERDALAQQIAALPRPAKLLLVATEGGDFASVAEAVASIEDASADNPYAVLVAPGVYTEESAVLMKPFVELVGSGTVATVLRRSAGADTLSADAAVLSLADQSVVRDLRIENDSSSGVFQIGVLGRDLSRDSVVRDLRVVVDALGGGRHYGLYVEDSDLLVQGVDVFVAGGSNENVGLASRRVDDNSTQPRIVDSVLEADNPANGVGLLLDQNSASVEGCELRGDFRAIVAETSGINTFRDCRVQTVGTPVMEQSGSATLLMGTTFFVGLNPVGNSNFLKYVHCIKPNHDPVVDGLGSSIE